MVTGAVEGRNKSGLQRPQGRVREGRKWVTTDVCEGHDRMIKKRVRSRAGGRVRSEGRNKKKSIAELGVGSGIGWEVEIGFRVGP